MRAQRAFLDDVERQLRQIAAGLFHDGQKDRRKQHISTRCRKCRILNLADEAADRAIHCEEI